MPRYVEELVFSGDDVRVERFPGETQFFYPNPPLPAVEDPREAIGKALDEPLDAAPLEEQLSANSLVTIAFDDLCVPVPIMRRDPRGPIILELLQRFKRIGIPIENVRLICANGLHRKWTLSELTLILGREVVDAAGAGRITCHDGTDDARLIHLGETPSGHEVEINRAVDESDLTIYVNVNFTSMNGGWKSVPVGLGSWRSIRHHHTPVQWNGADSLMDPAASPMHKILGEMGRVVNDRYPLFQIECVLNNQLWPAGLRRPLGPLNGTGAPWAQKAAFRLASLAPLGIKHAVRQRFRGDYGLVAVHAGATEAVHEQTLDTLYKQQDVKVGAQVDVLVLGIPNLSPYSTLSVFNPILLRSLVLGYMYGMFRGAPLVREGGVIIACNPGLDKFHPRHHPSYIDFWNHDLDAFRDPLKCWDELAEIYASNPVYVDAYRRRFAYHGAHCLMNWMWSGMALERLGRVILAGAKDPDTARKLGFEPAPDLGRALEMAKEMAGKDASIGYPVMPPSFAADLT